MKLFVATLLSAICLSAYAYDFTVYSRYVGGSLTSGCAPVAQVAVSMVQSKCNGRHAALENYEVKCSRYVKNWQVEAVGYCKSY